MNFFAASKEDNFEDGSIILVYIKFDKIEFKSYLILYFSEIFLQILSSPRE